MEGFMRIRFFVISVIVLISIESLFAQDMNISELILRVNELEKRIEVLENMLLEDYSLSQDVTVSNKASNKANWRKLKIGMKEEEVIILLGEPLHVQRYGPSLYKWEYTNNGLYSTVTFDDKGVDSWNEPK